MNLTEFQKNIVPLRHKLFRFSLRITGRSTDAEDVVQEVFERIWSRRDDERTENVSNWEAWSMTMARNLSIDKTRSKHRAAVALPEKFEYKSTAKTPDQIFQTKEVFNQVEKCMANLSEKQRSVMQLRDIEELSYDEIAEIMKITLEDVKISLHRARKTVREMMMKTI